MLKRYGFPLLTFYKAAKDEFKFTECVFAAFGVESPTIHHKTLKRTYSKPAKCAINFFKWERLVIVKEYSSEYA